MKLKIAMLMITLSLPLAGCGNKGPLVLPQAPVPVDQAVSAEPTVEEGTDAVPAADANATDPVPTEPVPVEPVPDVPAQDGDG